MAKVMSLATGNLAKEYPELAAKEAVEEHWKRASENTFFMALNAEAMKKPLKEWENGWSKGMFWSRKEVI